MRCLRSVAAGLACGLAVWVFSLSSAAAQSFSWSGTVSNSWDIQTTPNWLNPSGVQDYYYDGGNVTFGDSAANTNIAITAGGVGPASVTFTNNTTPYTFSGGPINDVTGGTTAVTFNGSGSVTFSATNNYTGGTTINAGTLVSASQYSLGTGPITLNGGALQVQGLSPPAPGTVLWLDAANAASLAVNVDGSGGTPLANGTVERWTSLVGGNYGSNASSTVTYLPGTLNGLPVLHVTGNDSTALTFLNQVPANGTLFIMFKTDSATPSWEQPIQGTGTVLHETDGDNPGYRCAVTSGGAMRIQPKNVATDQWHVQEVQVQAGNYALWIDNTPEGTNTNTTALGNFINVGGGNFVGDIAEVMVYPGILSSASRTQPLTTSTASGLAPAVSLQTTATRFPSRRRPV